MPEKKEALWMRPAINIRFSGFDILINQFSGRCILKWATNKNGQIDFNLLAHSDVGLPGFEPRQTEPKSVVLPLYYRPIRFWSAKIVL